VADEAPSLGTRAGGLLITFNLFYQLSNSHTIGEKIEKKGARHVAGHCAEVWAVILTRIPEEMCT
jgi:hypothetical protein